MIVRCPVCQSEIVHKRLGRYVGAISKPGEKTTIEQVIEDVEKYGGTLG